MAGLIALCALFASVTLHAQTPAPSSYVITIAGTGALDFGGDGGSAINASFSFPASLAIGRDGTLFISDLGNNRVRAIDPATGFIDTIAGNGTIVVDNFEADNNGDGGPAVNASILPIFLATDPGRHLLYAGDLNNNRVRQVNLATGIMGKFAGRSLFNHIGPIGDIGDGGPAVEAYFPSSIEGFGVAPNHDAFISTPCRVRRVNGGTGIIQTISGRPDPDIPYNDICEDSGDGGPASDAGLSAPGGIKSDLAGNLYFIEVGGIVRRIDAATGIITRFAGGGTTIPGTGPALAMDLGSVLALAPSDDGFLYISNTTRIFKVDLTTTELTPVAGNGTEGFSGDNGPALLAEFDFPYGLVAAPGGGLFVSDQINQRIRYIAPGSINLSGNLVLTAIYYPWISSLAGNLIITDNTNATTISLGSLTTVEGSVDLSGNTGATVIGLGSLTTVEGSLDLSGNTSVGSVDVPSATSVGGGLAVSANTSAGSIDLHSMNSVAGSVNLSGNNSATVINLGSLINAGGNVTVASNAANSVVDLSSLQTLANGITPATLKLLGGTVQLNNNFQLPANVTLIGSATLTGNITSHGKIAPGSSPGRFDLTGNLVLAAGSELRMELGGTSPGTGFDFVGVSGAATLGGTLAVSLINNFQSIMTSGESFTILTSGTPITGSFSNVASGGTLTTTDGYARFSVNYAGANAVQLNGLVIVDTDSDGLPDWWEDQFGLNKNSGADALLDSDGDGVSNLAEFQAGTDPRNPASAFRVTSLAPAGVNAMTVTWQSAAGKNYTVERSLDLQSFSTVSGSVPANGSQTSFTDPAVPAGASKVFYRVRLAP